MNPRVNLLLSLLCTFLLVFSSTVLGEIVVRIEGLEDLIRNGFECTEGNVEINSCKVKTAPTAADLPAYFPDSFRSLNGNNLMYIESSNASASGSFALVSSQFPIHRGTFVHFKMEYYTETQMTLGYMIFWADAGIGFFQASSNSEWKNDFAKSITRASFDENEVTYFVTNDKTSRFSVFRAIEFVIDPDPQIHLSITNLDEFTSSGAVCPNCRLGSVPSPSELPPLFPDTFRKLPANGNESIMFIDFQNTAHPTLIMADLSKVQNLSCTGYVLLKPEFYNEYIGSFGWGKTYGSWSPYAESEPSTWSTEDSSFFHLYYYLMQGNREVGFYSYNDGFKKMSVFRKLDAKIYYFPQPEVNCDSREAISIEKTPFADFVHSRKQN